MVSRVVSRQKIFYKFLWLLIFSLEMIGCGTQKRDISHFIAKIHAFKASPLNPLPRKIQFPELKEYSLLKKADPFKRAKFTHSLLPLERYPLSALKLVGTLQQEAIRWALIRLPSKEILPARVGDIMGQEGDKIIQIDLDEVRLEKINPEYPRKKALIYLSLQAQE